MSTEILADDVDILQPREVRELATTVRRQALVLQGVTAQNLHHEGDTGPAVGGEVW